MDDYASELLEALKHSQELFRELIRNEILEPTPEDFVAFDTIDAAIAKTEGRS